MVFFFQAITLLQEENPEEKFIIHVQQDVKPAITLLIKYSLKHIPVSMYAHALLYIMQRIPSLLNTVWHRVHVLTAVNIACHVTSASISV